MQINFDGDNNQSISIFLRSSRNRYRHLDVFRGLIIVIMALDHVSFFIIRVHASEFWGRPLPVYNSSIAFLSRTITHLCAPGFMFLMGASVVFLAESRKNFSWDDRKINVFILKRGCVLVVLELFVLNFAWLIGQHRGIIGSVAPPGGGTMPVIVIFGILSCLGCNLMLAGLLRHWSIRALFAVGLVSLLLSQLLTPLDADVNLLFSPIERLLFAAGRTHWLLVMYPILPWLTFVVWGIIFGKLLIGSEKLAMNSCAFSGVVFLVFFSVYRIALGFEAPKVHSANVFMDYLTVTKYSPSISFVVVTMGVNLLLLFGLWRFSHRMRLLSSVLEVYGRTSLFFYVTHVFLYLLIGTLTLGLRLDYPVAFFIWLVSVVALYPVCSWFNRVKMRSMPGSIIRFF